MSSIFPFKLSSPSMGNIAPRTPSAPVAAAAGGSVKTGGGGGGGARGGASDMALVPQGGPLPRGQVGALVPQGELPVEPREHVWRGRPIFGSPPAPLVLGPAAAGVPPPVWAGP